MVNVDILTSTFNEKLLADLGVVTTFCLYKVIIDIWAISFFPARFHNYRSAGVEKALMCLIRVYG